MASPFEDVSEEMRRVKSAMKYYQIAINKIDDYFEYRNESAKDRKEVHLILAALTSCFEELYEEK